MCLHHFLKCQVSFFSFNFLFSQSHDALLQSYWNGLPCISSMVCLPGFVSFLHSTAKVAVMFLLIKWSNDEGLICCDHRATHALEPPSSSFILSFCSSSPVCSLVIWHGDARYGRSKTAICGLSHSLRQSGTWDEKLHDVQISEREGVNQRCRHWQRMPKEWRQRTYLHQRNEN